MFTNFSSLAMPWHSNDEQKRADDRQSARPAANETTPGGQQEVRWVVVAEMPGLTPATIVAERLRLYGMPVRVWQESVGQAFGLAFGPMGTGYVAVPEQWAAEAQDILSAPEEMDDEPAEDAG